MELIDEAAFRAYWNEAGLAWERLHSQDVHVPSGMDRTKRDIPTAMRRAVVERDGWRCRFCGLRLLARDFIVGLNARCPDAFPWGVPDAARHAFGLVCLYTPDHVVPWWNGGGNELDNLVASCGTCNYQKGSCSLEELDLEDPRTRPAEVDGWDGYAGALR